MDPIKFFKFELICELQSSTDTFQIFAIPFTANKTSKGLKLELPTLAKGPSISDMSWVLGISLMSSIPFFVLTIAGPTVKKNNPSRLHGAVPFAFR